MEIEKIQINFLRVVELLNDCLDLIQVVNYDIILDRNEHLNRRKIIIVRYCILTYHDRHQIHKHMR